MTTLLVLFALFGVAPLALGLGLTARRLVRPHYASIPGSVLLCAIAFNLVFFWQELWLVIPKALTPGLHPVLFHNDHDWTGDAPIAELLQGSGAVATLAVGAIFAAILAARSGLGQGMRLFCFWMAFQGISQSFTQLAVGTMVPGNDVGRALTYLGAGQEARIALTVATAAALAVSGVILARLFPAELPDGRVHPSTGTSVILASAFLSVILIIPFRVPRSPIETTLIPLLVNLVGAGWTTLGFAGAPAGAKPAEPARTGSLVPVLCLGALLLVFQLLLRPGIRF